MVVNTELASAIRVNVVAGAVVIDAYMMMLFS